MNYFFFIYIPEMYLQFRKKNTAKALVNKHFWFTHSLLTAELSFAELRNFPKFACNFPCEKVNFSLVHPTHITIYSFWKTHSHNKRKDFFPFLMTMENTTKVLRFCQLSVKVTFKQTIKNSNYWIFLIFCVIYPCILSAILHLF